MALGNGWKTWVEDLDGMLSFSVHLQSIDSSSSVHCSCALNTRKCTPLLDSTAIATEIGGKPGPHESGGCRANQAQGQGRIWLWGFLAVIVMSQLYFVQELLAVFALFALGFATIAFVVASLYILQHCCELAVARLADIRRPVMNVAPVSRENQKVA